MKKPIGLGLPASHHPDATVTLKAKDNTGPYQLGDIISVDKDGEAYLAGTTIAHCGPRDPVIGRIVEIRESHDAGQGAQSRAREIIMRPTLVQGPASSQPWEARGANAYSIGTVAFDDHLGIINANWSEHDRGQSIWQKSYTGYIGQMFGVNLVVS
jgi:hypothetical protein